MTSNFIIYGGFTMRVDISGVVEGQPTKKNQSASFKLVGGGPYLYAYGQFGDHLLSEVKDGTAILASGSVNYAKDGQGEWTKYINLTGAVTVLPNKKKEEKEKAKLTFVTAGTITNITAQQAKGGNMAKFTVEETIVDFRGRNTSKHSMVAFDETADGVLALNDGQAVMVAGQVTRVRGRGDVWYTSFTAKHVIPVEVTAYAPAPQQEVQPELPMQEAQSNAPVDEDDLPF